MYELYCRLYQGVFMLVSPLLPWREPRLIEGPGNVLKLPALLKAEGLSRVLVVTDKGIAALGLMNPFLAELGRAGISFAVYDRTVPNPTIANIEEARALYLEEQCSAIVAFGGGSAMDCAKAVGARIARPRLPVSAMKGVLKIRKRIPPLFAVPTTAGTGSEATLAAVVSDPSASAKYPINDHSLIPRCAVLDPLLTLGLPPHITATTGMDALTHAVEAFIGRSNTRETEADAAEAARMIVKTLPGVYRDGSDVAGRQVLLKAAYLAGKAFTRAYVGYVHAMAHALGGFYGTPHGLANSVILPVVLERFGKAAEPRLALLARASGAVDATLPEEEAAKGFIAKIREMNRLMDIPERITGIRGEDIPRLAARAVAEANPLYPVPLILSQKDIEALYRQVAAGEARAG